MRVIRPPYTSITVQPIIISRTINASPERIFRTISDPEIWTQAHDHITKIEFLSHTRQGLGTRFRETRLMQGKEATTELAITECVPNERMRMVTPKQKGTIWDTQFVLEPRDGGVALTLTMDAQSEKGMAKLLNVMIRGLIAKQVALDMDSVKAFCEK
jgi:uncharacterized protein YndB with AHSA1/START domain